MPTELIGPIGRQPQLHDRRAPRVLVQIGEVAGRQTAGWGIEDERE
jgi:hypothetical protein